MRKKITKTKLLQIRKEWSNPLENKVFGEDYVKSAYTTLSPRACHLYLYMSHGIDRDLIHIDRHQYMKEADISRQETYMHAIADLVMANILYRYPLYSDLYFVNPHIFFKGNRLLKYKSLINPEKIRNAKYLNSKLL